MSTTTVKLHHPDPEPSTSGCCERSSLRLYVIWGSLFWRYGQRVAGATVGFVRVRFFTAGVFCCVYSIARGGRLAFAEGVASLAAIGVLILR